MLIFDQFLQLTIICTLLLQLSRLSLQIPIKSRRSALEGGYVSFTDRPRALRLTTPAPTPSGLKFTTSQPSSATTASLEQTPSVKPLKTERNPVNQENPGTPENSGALRIAGIPENPGTPTRIPGNPGTPETAHVRREWVPGHVKHHSFIPAHSHSVYVPARALLLAPAVLAQSTSQKYNFYEDDTYRSHYGGFGVGVDYGGQGAGHGYQVAL